jgi:hypothetical protein
MCDGGLEDNIKMDLQGTGYEIVDEIYLAQGIYQCRVFFENNNGAASLTS